MNIQSVKLRWLELVLIRDGVQNVQPKVLQYWDESGKWMDVPIVREEVKQSPASPDHARTVKK